MERKNSTVVGVIVPDAGMNVEAWKEKIIEDNQPPSEKEYAKPVKVEFVDGVDEDGVKYINYWVS